MSRIIDTTRIAVLAALALTMGCQESPVTAVDEPLNVLPTSYAIRELGLLTGGLQSQAIGGNASYIVGWGTDAGGVRRAVVFVGGAAVRLQEPAGATVSEARDVNAAGRIVGFADIAGQRQALLWASPTAVPQQLPTLGGPAGFARSINTTGTILGYATTSANDTILVTWTAAGVVQRVDPVIGSGYSPTEINDEGAIAGNAGDDDAGEEEEGFYFEPGEGFSEVETIGDAGGNDANAINGEGVIAGSFTTAGGLDRAYRWTESRGMVLMGNPPNGFTGIGGNAVNDEGIFAATATTVSSTGTVLTSVAAVSSIFTQSRLFTPLPTLGGTRSGVPDGGITPCGVILGWSFPTGSTNRRAVAWVPPSCTTP